MAHILVMLASWLALGSALPAPKFGMPAECAGSDWCTLPHELYPLELVERVLRSANISFAGAETGARAGSEEERDCDVLTSDEPIYEIVDAEGHVRVVLQAAGALQRVMLERCAAPGRLQRGTAHFPRSLVGDYNLQCVQRKMDIAFLALNKDWTAIEMVRAKTGIPVRCDCELYQL